MTADVMKSMTKRVWAGMALAMAGSLLLAQCGDSGSGPAPRVIEGVDLDILFAPPTQTEIDAVASGWGSRTTAATDVIEESSTPITLSGTPATLRIVSHTVDGYRHYGAIAAANDLAAAGSHPVLIYCHGGDEGENVNGVLSLLNFGFGGIPDDYVYVVPSFRSEPLTFNGITYTSEGPPSPWDRDVDDALSLLDVTLLTTASADPERIGIVGFSRGACVGMLMAIRDPRIDLVVEFFGPTDFYGEFVQDLVAEALAGELRDLPGLEYLNQSYIQPLKDGTIPYESVRRQMLLRSPVYFAASLPQLQLHHGALDQIVPVSQAHALIGTMADLNRSKPDFEWYIYSNGRHDPITMPGSIGRTEAFVGRLLMIPVMF